MIIAQITDLHVSTEGSASDRRYRTAEHLRHAVAHLNGLDPQPDVVLATGDLVNDGTADEYARLKSILDDIAAPLFLIPGNHDDRANLRTAFAGHDYLPADGDFLHYVVDGHPVRLIGLDTLIPGDHGGRLCDARLAWLDARLAEAPSAPTLLFMHHPPFRTGVNKMDTMSLDGRDGFGAVLEGHGQVQAVIAGHVHRPMTRRFHGTIAVTCPSTAHQIALDLRDGHELGVVMEPPACMLHTWLGPDDGLVSHQSYIGAFRGATLFDGERWLYTDTPHPFDTSD